MDIKDEITPAEIPAEFVARAFAFLDAAEFLNTQMGSGVWSSNYDRGQAVLWLTFHAVELFLKGFILKLDAGATIKGHSLRSLSEKLSELDADASFAVPFTVEFLPPASNSQQTTRHIDKVLHETFRYPIDSSGTPWPGIRGFTANTFATTLQELRLDAGRARDRLFEDVDV